MWETIKKILSKEGGKCIVIEEGKPAYLVMKLDDYEKGVKNSPCDSSEPEIEKVNRDIAEWKASEEKETETAETAEPDGSETNQEVKVEDLPF
jgi:hypothetical protein